MSATPERDILSGIPWEKIKDKVREWWDCLEILLPHLDL